MQVQTYRPLSHSKPPVLKFVILKVMGLRTYLMFTLSNPDNMGIVCKPHLMTNPWAKIAINGARFSLTGVCIHKIIYE